VVVVENRALEAPSSTILDPLTWEDVDRLLNLAHDRTPGLGLNWGAVLRRIGVPLVGTVAGARQGAGT
jgi:hypothetical protein